jgi:hypothetical protein
MAPAPAPASPPARSDVPLALWLCAQPDPRQPTTPAPGAARALLPAQLARRIVTEYTRPGALLVGPACPALLRETARLGRRAVALTSDPARARQASTTLDLSMPTQHLQLTHVCRGRLTDPAVVADLAGQAHALVTVNLDGHAYPASAADPASLAACAALLRPGGLLITVSRNQQQPGRLVDLAARTIRAAEQAGLAYLQHVVALLAPVQAGQLRPGLTGWQRRTLRARLARGEPAQHAVHADVLVFATPEAADA